MKNVLAVAFIIICVAFAKLAWSTPITFIDTTEFGDTGTTPAIDLVAYRGQAVNMLEGSWDYVIWTHHFEFDPPAEDVLSGVLTLHLRDNEGDRCKYCSTYEIAFGFAEDGTWGLGEVDTKEYSFAINASYLEDGSFTVFLYSLFGDFFIDRSDLKITYNSLAPVPEPGTILLLGLGLITLGLLGKKKNVS
ncbi:MAG: PEP-CTERM sorting domain-containing protein [Deltaproteobacteria bacterium]|nr:MAG: PEP-CTERM sorting domain-containing protein [Deltaproteobacteria bacterium]